MEALNNRNRLIKGAAGFSSATLIALTSYFYSFFSEKIPSLEQKITSLEIEMTNNHYSHERSNKDLADKIDVMRDDIKSMRQTQERIFEILIKLSRK